MVPVNKYYMITSHDMIKYHFPMGTILFSGKHKWFSLRTSLMQSYFRIFHACWPYQPPCLHVQPRFSNR